MKTTITIVLLFATALLKAEIPQVELWQLINAQTTSVLSYSPGKGVTGRKTVLLEMNFNAADWKNSSKEFFDGAIIESVELISSTFASSPTFDQDKLDQSRLSKLRRELPALFKDDRTQWKRVKETGGTSVESAKKLFHGFAVTLREPVTPELMKAEIKTLTEEFSGVKPVSTPIPFADTSRIVYTDFCVVKGFIYTKDTLGLTSTEKRKADKRIKTKIPTYAETSDGIDTPGASTSFLTHSTFSDSLVTVILRRNNKWKEMLVVCDITGSMSPYTAQLLAWYKLNTMNGRVKNFVFFNDGDMKPDNSKVAGSTGGLYGIVASQFDSVVAKAIVAMSHGGGGDCPENNVEALGYGLKNYGDAKEIVMIADNWATPRDMAFAETINRPVHIIVCGAAYGMNVAYLELARKTGGSVHTMEQDLTDLALMHEGETISIGAFQYKLVDGHFVQVGTIYMNPYGGKKTY